LRTISPSSDEILGVAKITEEIPRQFGIYDLEHLLKVISTLNHPILTPYEHHLEFKNERGDRLEFDSVWDQYKYPYCPVAQIKQPPEDYVIEQVITRFELPNIELQSVVKVLAISGHPEVLFVRQDNVLAIESFDPKKKSVRRAIKEHDPGNAEPDLYQVTLSNEEGINFQARLTLKRLKALLPTDYLVSIVKVVDGPEMVIFESEGGIIKYYVALDEFAC
jgi:hypothetical protein